MLDNVGLRYPHRASGAKAPRTLRPLPLLRFAVSATGGAHLCSIQYYLRFWLSICRTSLAVSALRILRYCLYMMKFVWLLARGTKESHPTLFYTAQAIDSTAVWAIQCECMVYAAFKIFPGKARTPANTVTARLFCAPKACRQSSMQFPPLKGCDIL